MKERILFVVLISMIFYTALPAQRPGQANKRIHRCMQEMEIPDLTEDQDIKIEQIHNQMKQASLPLKSEIEVAAAELKQMMIEKNPDKSAILKQVDTISALRANLMKLHIESQLKIRELLTVEQRIVCDQKILEGRGAMGFQCTPDQRPGMRKMNRGHRRQPGQEQQMMDNELKGIEE